MQTDQEEQKDVAESKKEQYDKAQQQIDQERANAKRAKEELARFRAEQDQASQALKDELTQTKQQLQELLKRQEDIDPEEAGVTDVAKYAKQLREEIAQAKQEIADAKRNLEDLKSARQKSEQADELNRIQEDILGTCDEEFGAQYRNEALKLADELVESGKIKQPTTPLEGERLMRRCYRDLAKKHKERKETTPEDGGGGSVSAGLSQIKEGSLQDVKEQLRKNPKLWKVPSG